MPDRKQYVADCAARWSGPALADAKMNWNHFASLLPVLTEALKEFRRDPFLKDLTGKLHNPDGTLTAMLWNLQANLEPDKSSLYPLLDFEEHFQKIFLKRGLIFYCKQILVEIENPPPKTTEPCLNLS